MNLSKFDSGLDCSIQITKDLPNSLQIKPKENEIVLYCPQVISKLLDFEFL